MSAEVVEGDGAADRPVAVLRSGAVVRPGQGEEDGGVPGTGG